ncbi:pyocin knob domain-containing protein [Pseudomonas sp. RL_105y_Pfl2_101]|uniref:pyocin knob domain-containing protein n=1 Tax=Pseudomonas sp. RL_105y_Pfl2_101 TaxID=3088708 RepID=UPI0030DA5418
MPWYKTGTVSVTLNSNAVTGTGTAFIANCRVGDAFRGPDGRWYEVTNVVSNTSMSIYPPYQGSTAAAGAYALAPMQGYVKDSADALRAIVNAYGAQLAALGTTGNYDILPVEKGGTGGTTQATARTGLGLGTAATATLTTTRSDSTTGRVLKVGDHGIGAENLEAIPSTTINDIRTNGFYYVSAGATQGSAPEATNGYLENKCITPVYAIQKYMTVTVGQEYERVLNNGTWLPWRKTYNSGNMVGAVSQVGGIPTGAIIESGTNSNGEYVRFADGSQICRYVHTTRLVTTASQGSLFLSPSGQALTFAMPFNSPPVVSPAPTFDTATGTSRAWLSNNPPTSSSVLLVAHGPLATSSCLPGYVAVGRWY